MRSVARGYDNRDLGISKSKLLRVQMREKFKDFVDKFENQNQMIGMARSQFDRNFNVVKK